MKEREGGVHIGENEKEKEGTHKGDVGGGGREGMVCYT